MSRIIFEGPIRFRAAPRNEPATAAQSGPAFADLQPSIHGLSVGVTMNIRKTFLKDAEQNQLDITGQPRQHPQYLEIHLNAAAFGKSFNVPTRR
jgi:hypothetical protein